MTEVWKDIVGYPGYKVSNKGRVSSGPRPGYARRMTIILKPYYHKGYAQYHLSFEGVQRTFEVHRLVLNAFVGEQPDMFALHSDNNPSNNSLDNLVWGTHQENMDQMVNDNRSHRRSLRQFNDEQVREIRASPLSCVKLSRIYKCGHTQIHRIKRRITYADVE